MTEPRGRSTWSSLLSLFSLQGRFTRQPRFRCLFHIGRPLNDPSLVPGTHLSNSLALLCLPLCVVVPSHDQVRTVLTTGSTAGRFKRAMGHKLGPGNRARLVGVAQVPKVDDDLLLNLFLMLPTDALAIMSAEFEFEY